MLAFKTPPATIVPGKNRDIFVFESSNGNIDHETVASFGEEWKSYHRFDENEIYDIGDLYFDILPPGLLNENSRVLEVGSGSGRFLWYLRRKFNVHATGVDPSDAVFAADALTGKDDKVVLVKASASDIPFEKETFDFVYSIGVLHHIPDTHLAMRDCVKMLKPGGYFLTYIYYNFDNRNAWFKFLYKMSNVVRLGVSKMSARPKKTVSDVLAVAVYMPLVLSSRFLRLLGVPKKWRQKIPLHDYEERSFYVIRNDSLDRFGTPLEQRFTKPQITKMMHDAGLTDIVFSEKMPYWHAIGRKI